MTSRPRAHEERRDDQVETLTVADVGLIPAEGSQDAAERLNALRRLVGRILGQAAIEVLLDLLRRERRLALVRFEDTRVLARMLSSQMDRAGADLPQLAT